MRLFLIILFLFTLVGCSTNQSQEYEIEFSSQQNFSYFGYITSWSRKLGIPSVVIDQEVAEFDFNTCSKDVTQRYINSQKPNRDIRFAFMVECMSQKGWFLVVEPYMVTQ
jgi:hypothetical protein